MAIYLRSQASPVNRPWLYRRLNGYLPVFILLTLLGLAQGQSVGQPQSPARGLLDVTIPQFIRTYQLTEGTQAWADWDKDGRIDLMLIGKTSEEPNPRLSKLYRNTSSGLEDKTQLIPGLPLVSNGALDWGDYDRDGRMDLILIGETYSGFVSKLYHNTGSGFEDKTSLIPGLSGYAYGAVAWADFDNDGWLDILISGKVSDSNYSTQIFRNTGNGFVAQSSLLPGLPQVANSTVVCKDFNRDGRPDVLITGETASAQLSRFYRSSPGGYVDATQAIPNLPAVTGATLAAGDYDNDGWLDLLVTGRTQSGPVSKLYHNSQQGWNTFEEILTNLPGVKQSKVAWGDYDRDGRPDLAIVGKTGNNEQTAKFSRLFRNTTAYGFVDVTNQLPDLMPVSDGTVAWGDYDRDGWLDLIVTGNSSGEDGYAFKLYHNRLGNSGGWEDISSIVPTGSPLSWGTPPAVYGTANWVTFEPDGPPDLHLTGSQLRRTILGLPSRGPANFHYERKDDSYVLLDDAMANVMHSSVDWADFNRDGLPDVLFAGETATGEPITRLYQSLAGQQRSVTYANDLLPPAMPGLRYASVAWGDYNNDGWPDIIITGQDKDNNPQTRLYHNLKGEQFEDVTNQLPNVPGVAYSSVAWGDYDNDGRKDLLLTGKTQTGQPISKLYHSTAEGFWDVSYLLPSLPGVSSSSVAWVDFDNDGLLDLMLTGESSAGPVTRLYRNRGALPRSAGFDEASGLIPNLPQVSGGAAAFGDYDNDGKPDLMLTGDTGNRLISQLYHNTGSGFEHASMLLSLPGSRNSSVAWIDYDNDSWLDLMLLGSQAPARPVTTLFQNVSTDVSQRFPGLPQLSSSVAAWGDYDGDSFLDVMMTGRDADLKPIAKLYRGGGGGFTDASDQLPNLPPLSSGTVSWIDYNNDNRLDLMLTGTLTPHKLYRNTGLGFVDESNLLADVPGLLRIKVAWADYDNDGRVDLLINGVPRFGALTRLYRNTPTGFEDQTHLLPNLPQIMESTVAWADVNRDGRPDLFLTGEYAGTSTSRLYLNQGGIFVDQTNWLAGLPGLSLGTVAFGDYDSDGWLDLFVSGRTSGNRRISKLFHNTGNSFDDVSTQLPDLPGLVDGSAAWGDWDNDGRLDLLITGQGDTYLPINRFYHNTGDGFELTPLAGVPAVYKGSMALGNYDGDGRLDLLLTGDPSQTITTAQSLTRLYRNLSPLTNTPPSAPAELVSQLQPGGTSVLLSWQTATDAQTPSAGLSYNLYVSETPRGQGAPGPKYVLPPLANVGQNGRRQVIVLGNSQGNSYTLTGLESGKTYYWSVQAIDGAFAGSPFAAEQSVTTSLLGDAEPALQLVAPVYNCQTGAFTFQTSGGYGSPIEYMAPGITAWTTNPRQYVDAELRQAADAQPITLVAHQSGKVVRYVFDLRAICPVGDPNRFRLTAPLYDCQRGAFTFQTAGGDGSLVEYMAAGITSWTTNPNHLLDDGLRTSADVKPLELLARQGNHEVRYVWDIRAICPVPSLLEGHCPCTGCCVGSARQGVATEPGTTLRAQLYPNPVGAEATLRLEGAQNQSVALRLIDLNGQTVLERMLEVRQSDHPERLDLQGLNSGLYLLRVRTSQQSLTLKVVKP